ncbi:MAG: glycosyltransferase N-terminal domain-containing protein [Phycisphaerales bacterium]|jgi:3-deoxy-D-manno-octulosonic-acid transferase|nr:glycosyltransferase N-terminal domain-containing protein [Phycisphaerales bacterium]
MRLLTDVGLLGVALVTSPWWFLRMVVRGRYRTDWPGRFGKAAPLGPPPPGGRILLHAVSVGEVGAIRGLVEQLRSRPETDVVIASTTDTGVARARALFGAQHTVVRWPLDISWCVGRFLRATRPTRIGLVELEVWPNMTAMSTAIGVPTIVVSGRLSQRSFRRYRLIRWLVQPMFRRLEAVAAQDDETAARFIALGARADRVQAVGNMKWDSAAQPLDATTREAQLATDLGIDRTRIVIVGGSTAPGEDAMLRAACPPGVQLICAPRRPEWRDEAAEALAPCVRRSAGQPASEGTDRFLLDTIGELADAYGLADIVVVGRSFGDLHGSDPVEPIARGAATVIGPAVEDFQYAVGRLKDGEGLIQTDAEGLAEVLAGLIGEAESRRRLVANGQSVIRAEQGATARCLELLAPRCACT